MTLFSITAERKYRAPNNTDFLKRRINSLQRNLDNIVKYFMLVFLAFAVLNVGYIACSYEVASMADIIMHSCEALIYGSMVIILYVLRKDFCM